MLMRQGRQGSIKPARFIMAENEALDLGASYAQRWDKPFKAVGKGAPYGEVTGMIRKALYGGVNKARKQFREHGAPLADFLAARDSRPKLRQLVRKTEGHHYAQLLESSAHANGSTPKQCLRGWFDAILDRMIDQICHRVAGTDNWPTFFGVKNFTDNVRRDLAPDLEQIATKLAQDPDCTLQLRKRDMNGESPCTSTEELLGTSLLGESKP